MSIISNQPLPSASYGFCDKGGLTAQPKRPTVGTCDGGGLTATPQHPMVGASDSNCYTATAPKKGVGATTVIASTVLLVGGALLGYGHKDQISKGLGKAKEAITKFFSSGVPAELLAKGKELLGKAKDVIFAKKA